ncbi:uncharacterized protein LOC111050983 [Nilaparvata lugens]|uniref:uncharacterized protein LOC111050983 n=1 Tax=Nilaparvata lugens TaxID=108931 RepID=UPI00193E8A53|nr:uncharacterized protein LOC111050983 [Nilaparvata lugens]
MGGLRAAMVETGAFASDWFSANRFLLNEDKTQSIVFSLRNGNEYNFAPVKLLGFTLDRKLSWGEHIETVCARLSRVVFLLRGLKYSVPPHYLKMCYFGFFQSVILYGLPLWGGATDVARVLRLQKRALRIICGAGRLAHCRPLFIKERILTVFSLYVLHTLCRTHANVGLLVTQQSFHPYETRGRLRLDLPYQRLSRTRTGLAHMSISLYNRLPLLARDLPAVRFQGALRSLLTDHPLYSLRELCMLESSVKWLDSNLEWINNVLLNRKLEVKHENFHLQEKLIMGDAYKVKKITHDQLISASKSLITLFEEHAELFGQLACLKENWELGCFMDYDVNYLKDCLKIFNLCVQDPTISHLLEMDFSHVVNDDVIDNVYKLCSYFGAFPCKSYNNIVITEDFLLPVLLFMKLMSKAGFTEDSVWKVHVVKEGESKLKTSVIEEGVMLVFGDGDVDSAIDTLINNYLHGPKQRMWIIKKVLVQETVYDLFIQNLVKQIVKIDSLPSDYAKNLDELEKNISDAKSVGIEVLETTFSKTGLKGPIIFKGEPPSCASLNQNNLLLPFIATQPFRTTEECITLANNNIWCTNASLWTESEALAMKVHKLLRMNTIWLNAHGLMDPLVPIYCPTKMAYFSIKWDTYRKRIHNEPPGQRYAGINVCPNNVKQKATKASQEWQKVDLLQRAKTLSNIAYNFRKSTDSEEVQHAADIFSYFAEKCHRSTHSASIVTKKGLYQISFEPNALDYTFVPSDMNDFEELALLVAPVICYGAPLVFLIKNNGKTNKYDQFIEILLLSGLPQNLFPLANSDPNYDALINFDDSIHRKLKKLLVAGNYNRNTFNFVLRSLSYHTSLPKVLWMPN